MDGARRGTEVFTVKALEALKPEVERYDYWCWSLPGFGIRVNPTGKKTFTYVYRFNRRTRRKTIGRFGPLMLKGALTQYHADAAKVREAAEQLANGEAPSPELDPGAKRVSAAKAFRAAPTLKEAATTYLTDIKSSLRPATVAEYERALRGYLLPTLGDQKPKSIRKRDLIAILDAIAAGEFRKGKAKGNPSRTMAEATKRVLSAFFGWMAKREIIDALPNVFMPKYQAPVKRDRFLSVDERKTFLTAVDGIDASVQIKGALKMALLTGQRIGAVSSMRWSDIDGDWWTAPAISEKNGIPNRVFLTETAKAILGAMPRKERVDGEGNVDAVFLGLEKDAPLSKQACGKAVARNRDIFLKHGIAEFSPHALRHTVRTGLSALRFPQEVKEAVLNHRNQTVGGGYDHHAFDDEKREALIAWESHLLALAGEQDSNVVGLRRRASKRA
jgi:integrase